MYPYIDIFTVKLSTFPLILMAAFFTCLLTILKSVKYDNLFYNSIVKSIPITIFFAVLGGKIVYALSRKGQNIASITDLFNGFVFIGGFFGALLGIFLYCKKNQYSYFDYTDIFTSILPLGQSIGRIGCYCNGCCYGKCWNGAGSVQYIVNGQMVRVIPTWFMESLFCLLLFLFFFSISIRKQKGFYTSAYMISYSIFRFFFEFFRGDEIRGHWFGISTSQFLCILSLIGGLLILFYTRKCGAGLIIIERKYENANK
jgi:phosphatidylglycerol:prolipoprotein diacylglycerol transferase